MHPRAREHPLDGRQAKERPEREPRRHEPVRRTDRQRIFVHEPLSFLIAEGGRLLQELSVRPYRFGFVEPPARKQDEPDRHGRLNGAGEEGERGANPAVPRACEHDELGIAEAHSCAAAKLLVTDDQRKPNADESHGCAEKNRFVIELAQPWCRQSEESPPNRDRVRKIHVRRVDEGGDDERHGEREIGQKDGNAMTERSPCSRVGDDHLGDGERQPPPEKLHDGVSRGDTGPATTRAPAKQDPRQNGDIVVRPDVSTARRAVRSGVRNTHVARQPVDDDVCEASPEAAPQKREHSPHPKRELDVGRRHPWQA
jgi:hypothetical protein